MKPLYILVAATALIGCKNNDNSKYPETRPAHPIEKIVELGHTGNEEDNLDDTPVIPFQSRYTYDREAFSFLASATSYRLGTLEIKVENDGAIVERGEHMFNERDLEVTLTAADENKDGHVSAYEAYKNYELLLEKIKALK